MCPQPFAWQPIGDNPGLQLGLTITLVFNSGQTLFIDLILKLLGEW